MSTPRGWHPFRRERAAKPAGQPHQEEHPGAGPGERQDAASQQPAPPPPSAGAAQHPVSRERADPSENRRDGPDGPGGQDGPVERLSGRPQQSHPAEVRIVQPRSSASSGPLDFSPTYQPPTPPHTSQPPIPERQPADAVATPSGSAGPAAIPAPTVQPGGALTTHIGEPTRAEQIARAVRVAQARAQQDVSAIAAGLAEIASTMHRHVRALEQAVEGQFSTNLADPRTRLLSDSLEVARAADLRLAQLDIALRRLAATVQSAQSNVDALQRERERLSTLYQIAQELNTSLDLEDVFGRVMAKLIEVVHAERGFLMLWNEAEGRLDFVAARGADGQPLAEGDFGISRGIVERVWSEQQPILTTDAQADERLHRFESIVVYGIHSVMCAPLRVRGKGVGVVYVDSRREARLFDAAHLDLLAAFCNQAAIAIDNARLFADLRRHIREITAIKTYMDNIFASIASGVVTADTAGTVTTFNRAAERIFDLPLESAVGKPYDRVLEHLGDTELTDILRRALAHFDETLGYETTPQVAGRGEVALRLNVSPLRAGEGEGEPLGVALVVDDLTELRRTQRQAEEIQRLFGRYVHPAVVRQLLADPLAVNLGGETREISIVFADIRGYTHLAEQAAPEELVRLLNENLRLLTEAVWQEEGTLTMFIGDALMAIFNAPLAQPDHALRAVCAAWKMRLALQARTESDGESGLLPVQYGIGVHTGLAVVGNIGARGRLQNYTAIGDAVNTAQRLQASASNNQILLSAATYLAVAPHVQAHPREVMQLKGKTMPLQVYELEGVSEESSE